MHHCPTWQWACGDEMRAKAYLPKTKQFLITRNVPCSRRCKEVCHVLGLIRNIFFFLIIS